MTYPKPRAVALKAARALSIRHPPHDDWCRFSYDVGVELSKLNARDGFFFDARYLALGIFDAIAVTEALLDQETAAAENDPERQQAHERSERMRELIRLVTIEGKPVK